MVKYKHNIVVIDIDTVEDSHFFQKLLFSYGFNWSGWSGGSKKKQIFDDKCCYYYLYMTSLRLTLSGSPGNKYLSTDQSIYSNGKIYSINNYMNVINIIKYGSEIPNYKPKKIIREL